MEIRQLEQRDSERIEQFLARVPEGDRTFFKENVDSPEVVEAWARPGAARAIAVEDDRVRRLHGRRAACRVGRATSERCALSSIPIRVAEVSAERSRSMPCLRH